LANGVPIREVSRWLGHKSIKTTVDIYGHLVPEAWVVAET
jgi:integrase